mmetsp:Transcript_14628/g.22062  ORF Transcript_14628/g.22062 Transcript_14628/m.22062 type:complete len:1104 (-) Transcript_14628:253-3564(-)|eukprot:CAMPEP_0185028032 /NCGR_PEP_ID=MMETSP1103-20130426/13462_1 /TAXON_ID=36769 /ORGANISM="Paraphysomonas bandaiensis, Strain Caron Lab Isolate" /LENGTH=1103 /DNA_ID=CAMNT_0027562269 /DNA_START=103 /DNA_END=3414 /DNA_ORIENTATION=-
MSAAESICESDVDVLIQAISPTEESNSQRRALINYISNIFRGSNVGCYVAMGGSFPLRVYLPESDLDVVVLTPQSFEEKDDLQEILQIFSCLCGAIKENEKAQLLRDFEEHKIQSIEFVNARIRVVKCVVNKTSLDITANQRSSLASATFLEEADRIIGNNHLYKRSVLLIKAWCLHESVRYCGTSILGSKEGMLSSYAVSILALYLFNVYYPSDDRKGQSPLSHPLHVLRAFLQIFSRFQWDSYVVTLEGVAPIRNGTQSPLSDMHSITNPFREIAEKVYVAMAPNKRPTHSAVSGATPSRFSLRCCNIVDPVDTANNLGISVSWRNLKLIKSALMNGCSHMESVIATLSILKPADRANLSELPIADGGAAYTYMPGTLDFSVSPVMGIAPGLSTPTPSTPTPNTKTAPVSVPIAPSISSGSISGQHSSFSRQTAGPSLPPAALSAVPSGDPYSSPDFTFLRSCFPNCVGNYALETFALQSFSSDSQGGGNRSHRSMSVFRPPEGIADSIDSAQRKRSSSCSLTSQISSPQSQSSDCPISQTSLDGDVEEMWEALKHAPLLPTCSASPNRSLPIDISIPTPAEGGDAETVNTDGEHSSPGDSGNVSIEDIHLDSDEPEDIPVVYNHIVDRNEVEHDLYSEQGTEVCKTEQCGDCAAQCAKGEVDLFSEKRSLACRTDQRICVTEFQQSSGEKGVPCKPPLIPATKPDRMQSRVGDQPSSFHTGQNKSRKKKGRVVRESPTPAPLPSCSIFEAQSSCRVSTDSIESLEKSVSKDSTTELQESIYNRTSSQSSHIMKNRIIYNTSQVVSAAVVVGVLVVVASHFLLYCSGDVFDLSNILSFLGHRNRTAIWSKDMPIVQIISNGKSNSTPYSRFLEDYNGDEVELEAHIQAAEMWLVDGDDATVGLNKMAQDMLYYLTTDGSQKLHGMWLKNGEAYRTDRGTCVHDGYLSFNSVNSNTTPGLYSFVVVKGGQRDPLCNTEGVCRTPPPGCFTPSSEAIVKTLSRIYINIGVSPSSKTKPKHLVLTTGTSQLYIHVQAEGSPPPAVQWFRNGIALVNETKSNLIVNNVDKSHEGTYSCELKNIVGVYTWLEATVIVRSNKTPLGK